MIAKITENDCKRFLNRRVGVAVNNWTDSPQRLFWHFGNLIEVSNESVKISTRNGFRIIDLADIKEIKEAEF